ncbi:hypothetical protein BLS_000920 [Venturia inaequalis]|uniref:Maf-like protein n=1 Tax=Venturia inaequalis TaxID=5025 RepID=A0A8H3UUB5_VENIN|nr:hypothetical protein EG328_002930 [Venturia inaequalis]KAE9978048.1 hypothetical protein BLS_000920 [Venturia inaequalis]RDI76588.1 hypothetical protein Vi05172_g13456 [Venturia inaequalis]
MGPAPSKDGASENLIDLGVPASPPPSYSTPLLSPTGTGSNSAAPSTPVRPRGPRPILPLELPALASLKDKRVILASASPRRKLLLAQIGLTNLEIIPSTFAENLSKDLSPFEYVLATATEKAIDVYQTEIDSDRGEPALVIAADTIVVSRNGQILEKPKSETDHIMMLKMLRDTDVHKVYTAVCLMKPMEEAKDPGYDMETCVEETIVKFDDTVTDDLLLAYVRTREGADKAGGYGIQGMGSILVERIEGTFDNVVGLPLRATLRAIEKIMEPAELSDDDLSFAR